MNMNFGEYGYVVRQLQKKLQELGFYTDAVDGEFGYPTFIALRQFQKAYDLVPDGILNIQTYCLVRGMQSEDDKLESVWYYEGDFTDFSNNADKIDVLVPFWFRITIDGSVVGEVDQRVLDLADKTSTEVQGLVSNFLEDNFSKELIDAVLTNPKARDNAINSIVATAIAYDLDGINLDFEFISPENRDVFTTFVKDLYAKLQPLGKKLTISTPAKTSDKPDNWFHGAYDYEQLAKYSDEMFIMTYDYHWFGGDPGPISPIYWVKKVIDYAITTIPKEKIKIGTPVYGYDWPVTYSNGQPIATGKAKTLSYIEAIGKAQLYGATIEWDDKAKAPFFNYETEGQQHQVWFEDASSFSWKYQLAREYDLGGFAAWRLGQEDAQIWTIV